MICRHLCCSKSDDWGCSSEGSPRLHVYLACKRIQHVWCRGRGGSWCQAGAGCRCANDPGGNHPGQPEKNQTNTTHIQKVRAAFSLRQRICYLVKASQESDTAFWNLLTLEITVYPKDVWFTVDVSPPWMVFLFETKLAQSYRHTSFVFHTFSFFHHFLSVCLRASQIWLRGDLPHRAPGARLHHSSSCARRCFSA